MPIARRGGAVELLTDRGWPGVMDLPRMAEDLVESARRLRMFVAKPVAVETAALLGALEP